MDIKTISEILVILIISFRIYTLEKFKIQSAADKLFALYYLKNHYPLLGYTIVFYILEIILIELFMLQRVDIALIFIFMIEIFLIYRHIFISLKTDDKNDYIDTVIKRMFKSLTYDEYIQIKGELYKKIPMWKLYMTEIIVFFFAIWSIEIA